MNKQTSPMQSPPTADLSAAVRYLNQADDGFETRPLDLFDGQPSRVAMLSSELKQAEALDSVRGAFGANSLERGCVQFWRLNAGDYVLPLNWAPEEAEGRALRILVLSDLVNENVTVSTDDGAVNYPCQAGKTIAVERPCMFWIAPTQEGVLYIAVSGLSQTAKDEALTA